MKNLNKILFSITLFVCLYWFLVQNINVYEYAITGVVYELFWLPILGVTVGLPIVSLMFWIKTKFKFNSLFLYTFLLSTSLLGYMYFFR